MWSLLFGLGSTIVEVITSIYAYFTLMQWLTIAAAVAAIFMAFKAGISMLDFLTTLLKSTVTRWILGGLLIFSIGAGVGYCGRGETVVKKSNIQEVPIRKLDSRVRSLGLVKDGKLYYPGVFINKHLEKKGSSERFKETYP